jgi:hypothetical protein
MGHSFLHNDVQNFLGGNPVSPKPGHYRGNGAPGRGFWILGGCGLTGQRFKDVPHDGNIRLEVPFLHLLADVPEDSLGGVE